MGQQKKIQRAPRVAPLAVPLARRRLLLKSRISIESNKQAISRAVHAVLAVAQESRLLGDDGKAELEIALHEALANAVIHGNRSDPAKRVLLRCYFDPGHGMLIAVRDQGPGFDPDEVPDPRAAERLHLTHGRGIFLMRELMDAVEHRKGGREVVLYKKLPVEQVAPAKARPASRRSRP